jgi:hypothetical protein
MNTNYSAVLDYYRDVSFGSDSLKYYLYFFLIQIKIGRSIKKAVFSYLVSTLVAKSRRNLPMPWPTVL